MQRVTTHLVPTTYSRQDFANATESLLTPLSNSDAKDPLSPLNDWEQCHAACIELPRLRHAQLKAQLELAWDSFCEEGGLERLNTQWRLLQQEATLRMNAPFGITSLNLMGRLDALIEITPDLSNPTSQGRLLLLDYKTTRSTYNTPRAQAHFEAAVLDETQKTPHLQLPLYRLMLQQNPAYQNRPIDIGLQLIRPKRYGGSPLLIIRDEQLQEAYPIRALEKPGRLERLLKQQLAKALESPTPFQALGDVKTCQRCDYKRICERGEHLSAHAEDLDWLGETEG
jgi:PD-(D/E)XK nuclease superfamily